VFEIEFILSYCAHMVSQRLRHVSLFNLIFVNLRLEFSPGIFQIHQWERKNLTLPQSGFTTFANNLQLRIFCIFTNCIFQFKFPLTTRYKQAKFGDCNSERPGGMNLKGQYKWDAWNSVRGECASQRQR
jgi:hypothetical protein